MKTDTATYFAYGSNMGIARLQARIGSARPLGRASLPDHALVFHKKSKDGSAKCDICPAPGTQVLGVVFEVLTSDLRKLDRIEGCGYGYERRTVQVVLSGAGVIEAQAYKATAIDSQAKPYTWYKRHVEEGAKAAGLPEGYMALIQNVEAVPDPDRAREDRELAIYSETSLNTDR